MTTLTIDTAGPADPRYVLELASGFAEIPRALNHLTRHHEALRYPSEVDRLIREISSGVSRLPQLLEQAGTWLDEERAAEKIGVLSSSKYAGRPDSAAIAACVRLDRARAAAADFQHWLDAAASVTCDLEGVEGGRRG